MEPFVGLLVASDAETLCHQPDRQFLMGAFDMLDMSTYR
jgi:hypothetical protein